MIILVDSMQKYREGIEKAAKGILPEGQRIVDRTTFLESGQEGDNVIDFVGLRQSGMLELYRKGAHRIILFSPDPNVLRESIRRSFNR